MIAIGGAIGTGLFMGSGKTISLAGPSILLVYAIIGGFLFFVMRAMGELLLSNLNYKSFRDIAEDILGPWAGFFAGWTYWFCWIVIGVADLTAVTAYAAYWFPDLPKWVAATCLVLLLLVLNLVTVKLFGEIEFWFALIKIVAIVGLVVVAVVMVASGFISPDGTRRTSPTCGRTAASSHEGARASLPASRSPSSPSSASSWSARPRPRPRTRR